MIIITYICTYYVHSWWNIYWQLIWLWKKCWRNMMIMDWRLTITFFCPFYPLNTAACNKKNKRQCNFFLISFWWMMLRCENLNVCSSFIYIFVFITLPTPTYSMSRSRPDHHQITRFFWQKWRYCGIEWANKMGEI